MSRLTEKLKQDGLLSVGILIWRRFIKFRLEQVLFSNHVRSYYLAQTLKVCMPVVKASDVTFIENQLDDFSLITSLVKSVELTIPHLPNYVPKIPPTKNIRVVFLEISDELMLISCTLGFKYIIIDQVNPDSLSTRIYQALQKLDVSSFNSVLALVENLKLKEFPPLRGKVKITLPTYTQLCLRLVDGHYGYTEALEWNIISELPRKFEIISSSATVTAIPVSNLFLGYGRASRQFAVGKLYGERYLSGDTVLDVGCDICGVKKYIGSKTQYVGVDKQGLADYYIDLDKEILPFEHHSFDTVLCFETLEHLQNIHQSMDQMMLIAKNYFIGSLFVESAHNRGRTITTFGEPIGNAHLPLAPVFDRHNWIFTFSDALDFIYYRAKKSGFDIIELNLFYKNYLASKWKKQKIEKKFKKGNIFYLAHHVQIIGFVLKRA
ncbi:methyltransferase domain-containing protein [Coleofasciculus sp.]|uniref:methyltransferase domain-containing protein n=1 Tax=Coleofasciculus sp. TaxID=3100458 RepID=UPI0039F7BE19